MPGLAEVVRGLAARDGVDAVVLVSPDGLPIDHAARGTCDADALSALATTVLRPAARIGESAGGGAPRGGGRALRRGGAGPPPAGAPRRGARPRRRREAPSGASSSSTPGASRSCPSWATAMRSWSCSLPTPMPAPCSSTSAE